MRVSTILTRLSKPFLLLGILLGGALTGNLRAQSISDLVMQLRLDREKLSSLKSTLELMYKGFKSIKNIYTNIANSARSSFELHQQYLDNLWLLSDNVRSDPGLSSIFNTERAFLAQYNAGIANIHSNIPFTPIEITYITHIYASLLERCSESIEELTMLTTNGKLQMTDAQRLQAIERIDTETKSQLAAVTELNGIVAVQSVQRKAAAGDISTLKIIYGLPD